jgi:hypothetical protein
MVDEKSVLPLGDFLFPRIFQAFRMAIGPSKLAIAFAALTIICLTGWIMDLSRTVVTGSYAVVPPRGGSGEIRRIQEAAELDIYLLPDASLKNFIESREATGTRTGVFCTLWRYGDKEFHNALYAIFSWNPLGVARSAANGVKALIWAFRWHTTYSIIFFTVVFVALSLAGGAICRIAALQFTQAERPGLRQAVHFALRRPVSLLGGPMIPVVLILAFGAPIMLMGLAGNLPIIGELLTGLFLLLAFVAACAVTVILVGATAGLGLMSPAVAYEDSDSFDAINHSLSYVYAKPWHMGFYTSIAVVYGAVCYVFVRLFGFLLLWTTYRFLEIGFLGQNEKLHWIWPEPTFANFLGTPGAMPHVSHMWSLVVAAVLVRISVLAIIGLTVSFVISFYFSANTIIYALMRHRTNGTPLEEIYIRPGEASAELPLFEAGPEATASPSSDEPATARNGGSVQELKTSE